jgi:hypothetical protein
MWVLAGGNPTEQRSHGRGGDDLGFCGACNGRATPESKSVPDNQRSKRTEVNGLGDSRVTNAANGVRKTLTRFVLTNAANANEGD